MENYQEQVEREKKRAVNKAIDKKNSEDLNAFGKLSRFMDDTLEKQIRLFRFLFGSIPASIGIDVFLQLRDNDQTIELSDLYVTLIIWLIFGIGFIVTYKIEHWDIKRSSLNTERIKSVEKKFEYIDSLRTYTLEDWIPSIDDVDSKIEVFGALGKMINMINVADIKDDMAQLHSSLAESLNVFLSSFASMKKELQKEMYSLLPQKHRSKSPDREELEAMMDQQLEGKSISDELGELSGR